MRKNEKERGVWIVGPKNTGKSTLIGILMKIFHSEEYELTDGFDKQKTPSKYEPQLVITDEANSTSLF